MKAGAAFCFVAFVAAGPARAQIISVTPQTAPRAFGYFVGDLITGISVVTVGAGVTLDVNSLPAPGPAATAIDIRSVSMRMSGTLAGQHQYTIKLVYQDFVSPDRAVRVEIPSYKLSFLQSGKHLTAQVAGFGFTASPFRDDVQPVLDPSVLQPDHAASFADEVRPLWWLGLGAATAAVAMAGLLLQQLQIPGFRRQAPFAAAARRIARRRHASPTATTDALLSLHAAFDATDGARLFADDVDRFIDRHRWFAPLRTEIDRFFQLSRTAFFGAGDPPGELNFTMLKTLSRDLKRAERRT